MKKILVLSFLASFFISHSQNEIRIGNGDLPPNSKQGECYVRCLDDNGDFGEWKAYDCDLAFYSNLNLKFDDKQIQLTEKDKKRLKRKLIEHFEKGFSIEIASHFDSERHDKVNARISTLRGKAVADYLVNELGVNPKQIALSGYGNLKPINPCDKIGIKKCTQKHYDDNTRVEFKILNFQENKEEGEWIFLRDKGFWCYKKKAVQETISN